MSWRVFNPRVGVDPLVPNPLAARPPRAASGVTASASCPPPPPANRRGAALPLGQQPDQGRRARRTWLSLPTAPLTPSSYVLGLLLRTREKYITAKATSSTSPTIKIKVVTIASHRLDLISSVLVATGMSDA